MSPFPSALPLLGLAAALVACSAGGTAPNTSTGGSGTGGHTTTTTTTTADDCATLCATETKACPMTTTACVLLCEANKVEVTWCKAEVTAATDCLAKQPASSFQCGPADAGGQPSPNAGVCATETAAMTDCWYNGPPGGLPDQTSACMGVCNKEMTATPSCYDSSCVSECEASVAAGQKCNGAIAAYVTCAWRQAASAFACDSESPPRSNLKSGYCVFEALLVSTCLQM